MPLIDSKIASARDKFVSVYIKGTEHSSASNNHDETVIMKASFKEIFKSTFLFVITSEPPTIK